VPRKADERFREIEREEGPANAKHLQKQERRGKRRPPNPNESNQTAAGAKNTPTIWYSRQSGQNRTEEWWSLNESERAIRVKEKKAREKQENAPNTAALETGFGISACPLDLRHKDCDDGERNCVGRTL
jgi:hypothetical protein